MTDKQKLLSDLADKSGKKVEEIKSLVSAKVDELSGLVSDEGAIYIIANDLGVRLDNEQKPKRDVNLIKIDEINEPKTPVSFNAKVIRKYEKRTFTTKDGSEGAVQNIFVGDETGVTRVVFWNEQTDLISNVNEGDIVKILNGYTTENNQYPDRVDVRYSQYSEIEINPEGVEINLPEFKTQEVETTEKKISELEEGDRSVKLTAKIVDFEIPRYYVGCPECFKKVMQDDGKHTCANHSEVEGIKIPIVNLVVDDGTGSVNIVGFRDRASSLTELSNEEIVSLSEDIEKYRDFSKKIIGGEVTFVGNVTLNNMTGDKQVFANNVDSLVFNKVRESKVEEVSDMSIDDIEDIELDEDLL